MNIPDLINLRDSLNELIEGRALNPSEERTVSHTIYREKNLREEFELISSERERIKSFLEEQTIRTRIKNLVCLSIGGSRLGPELLHEFQSLDGPVNVHFCSSFDPHSGLPGAV